MGVFQLGEKLNGFLDAVDAKVQVIDLFESDPDLGLLGRRVSLARGDRKGRFGGGVSFLAEGGRWRSE
jgi:hypothetical protein